jgi:phage RecT family recombinase
MGNELVLNPKTVYAELQKMRPQLEAALPRHITADRMARIAFTQIRINPALLNCSPDSFYGAIIAAAQLGLEPGVNGQCYLIPYKNTCTLVPGWKGYMDLVSRAGRASAWTGVVRKGDLFEFKLGSNPKIEHEPSDDDTGEFTHVYAVGWVKDAPFPIIEVWSRAKVMKHLKQYNRVGDRHYALANDNNLEMYARKVALLQVIKYLPMSVELAQASALDLAANDNKQNLTIDMALRGELDGPSQKIAEAEALMQQLGWDDKKRNACRDMYEGRVEDQIKYLESEAEKSGKRTTTPPAKPNGNGNGGAKQAAPAQEYVPTSDQGQANADLNF